jgi:hypothetical protein
MPAQNCQLKIILTDDYPPLSKDAPDGTEGWVDCLGFIMALGVDDIDLKDVCTYAGILWTDWMKALITFSAKGQPLLASARRQSISR